MTKKVLMRFSILRGSEDVPVRDRFKKKRNGGHLGQAEPDKQNLKDLK